MRSEFIHVSAEATDINSPVCTSWNEMKCSLSWSVSSGDSWILQSKHSCEEVLFFIVLNLVFENKSGATLPGLDREALCLSPEWELLGLTAWQLQPLPVRLSFDESKSHLVLRRMKDMLKAAQSLSSVLFYPGLWGHVLVKDHLRWPKNRNSLPTVISSKWGLSLQVIKHLCCGQPTF